MEKAFDLTPTQALIVCKNIQLRDKLNILRTIVSITHPQHERFGKMLKAIGDLSLDRNMMAHDVFFADSTGDGVKFLVVRAKGKFAIPPTTWSVADFWRKFIEIGELSLELETLTYALRPLTLTRFLREGGSEPRNMLAGLGLLGFPDLPPQPNPDSGNRPTKLKK